MKSTRAKKIVIALLLLGAAFVTTLVGGAIAWRAASPDLRARGKAALREGEAYARGRDASACVSEGIRRLQGLSLLGEAENKSFVTACLRRAPPDAAVCAPLPPRTDAAASARWAASFCAAERASQPDACARLVGALQRACDGVTPATPARP